MRTSSLSTFSRSNTPKNTRIVVSFRIDKKLWLDFDNYVTSNYGNYKKSPLLESMIRQYMEKQSAIEKYKEDKKEELSRL